ncbi:MAG: hypothetical protein K0Q74_848 [Gammaproteobacteria bacterium]|nr:hypothetical protein [Gammaproteobacteria bacterium]
MPDVLGSLKDGFLGKTKTAEQKVWESSRWVEAEVRADLRVEKAKKQVERAERQIQRAGDDIAREEFQKKKEYWEKIEKQAKEDAENFATERRKELGIVKGADGKFTRIQKTMTEKALGVLGSPGVGGVLWAIPVGLLLVSAGFVSAGIVSMLVILTVSGLASYWWNGNRGKSKSGLVTKQLAPILVIGIAIFGLVTGAPLYSLISLGLGALYFGGKALSDWLAPKTLDEEQKEGTPFRNAGMMVSMIISSSLGMTMSFLPNFLLSSFMPSWLVSAAAPFTSFTAFASAIETGFMTISGLLGVSPVGMGIILGGVVLLAMIWTVCKVTSLSRESSDHMAAAEALERYSQPIELMPLKNKAQLSHDGLRDDLDLDVSTPNGGTNTSRLLERQEFKGEGLGDDDDLFVEPSAPVDPDAGQPISPPGFIPHKQGPGPHTPSIQ